MKYNRPNLSEQALWGLGGDITKRLCENAESDPAAVLFQLYALIGNIMGRAAYVEMESNKMFANLFVLLVGETGRGRKGTSFGLARSVLEPCFENYVHNNIKSGLLSGQGLLYHIRDASAQDAGVKDKRLLIKEAEFATCFNAGKMDASILSTTIREAFDSNTLSNLVKHESLKATNPHVSFIGHITPLELNTKLTSVDISNGFANRFLFVFSQKSRTVLNFDGGLNCEIVNQLSNQILATLSAPRLNGRADFSNDAKKLLNQVYPALSYGTHGIVGDLGSRAMTHIFKTSLVISVLNQESEISIDSVKAAIHLVQYSLDTINHFFSNSLGSADLDLLYDTLRNKPEGLARSEISELFNKNKTKASLGQIIQTLKSQDLIFEEKITTTGAPKTIFKVQPKLSEFTILTKKEGLISLI